jgi:hypothetical protein
MGAEGELVALRLERGCRCFAAFAADGLIAYGWLSAGPEWIGELGLQITPGRGEAYVWNCVTLAPHRRRGVFRGLLTAIARGRGEEGLRRLWIGSVEPSADQAVIDAGFAPVLRFEVTRAPATIRVAVSDHATAPPAMIEAARRALGLRRERVIERPAVKRKH